MSDERVIDDLEQRLANAEADLAIVRRRERDLKTALLDFFVVIDYRTPEELRGDGSVIWGRLPFYLAEIASRLKELEAERWERLS